MDFTLDLSNTDADRFFIVGDILGEYDKLIHLLYQQRFGYKDILITTGNFINETTSLDPNNEQQLEAILFIKNVMNTYSVKGKNEFNFLRKIKKEGLPEWLNNHSKNEQILNFIDELPLIIKVFNYIYIVNAGVQPNVSMDNQNPEVFYSIGDFDVDSRFYKFSNPEEKSWYDFEIFRGSDQSKICFGGNPLSGVECPAGYSLGRTIESPIRALILTREQNNVPIILES